MGRGSVKLLHPGLLLLGPASALLLALTLVIRWRRLGRLAGFYGESATRRIIADSRQGFPSARMLCLAAACFALATGAAGPYSDPPERPEPSSPLNIAIAVDVSRSMGAPDVGPTRIERARVVVDHIAEALHPARIVLVVFADWPYTLVPPTDDPQVVRYFAGSLNADLMADRDQGTSLARALAHARASLDARPLPGAKRALVLISDGGANEDADGIRGAAASASEGGVTVWTAGLGTAAGSELGGSGRPVLDAEGRPVVARLNEELLEEIARLGGGRYEDVGSDRGLEALLQGLGAPSTTADRGNEEPLDAAFWLALVAVPLLLAEAAADTRRRGRAVGTRTSVS